MANVSSGPSKSPKGPFREGELDFDLPGIVESMTQFLRAACLVGVFVLLVTAAYFSLDVFRRIGQLVQDPESVRPAVKAIADMISADQMVLKQQQGDQDFRVGEALAFLLLMASYLLWLYVPATIMSVCARVLLSGYSRRGR